MKENDMKSINRIENAKETVMNDPKNLPRRSCILLTGFERRVRIVLDFISSGICFAENVTAMASVKSQTQ